jgi:acetyl-CoA carboxylase carboxyltransferase component
MKPSIRSHHSKIQQSDAIEPRKRQVLSPRERIECLLDADSFTEIGTYLRIRIENDQKDPEALRRDGIICGFGKVHGRNVAVYAHDFSLKAGSIGYTQSQKITRVMDYAYQNRVPLIALVQSGGARIQEGVHSLNGIAEILTRNTQNSGVIPQISVIFGASVGGAAFSAALTDFIIMAEEKSYMFISSPKVIEAATGEVFDNQTLGGGEIQASLNGTAALQGMDDQDCIDLCKELLSYLPSNNTELPPRKSGQIPEHGSIRDLDAFMTGDGTTTYSMYDVITEIADEHAFFELHSHFARNAITGFIRLDGYPVGMVANQPNQMEGLIDIAASEKMSRFIRICDSFNIPIVSLVDTPGFMPGAEQEHKGIVRQGAKLVYAYAEAAVPKVTLVTRRAFGGAFIAMGSKGLGTDINLAWPTAKIAVLEAQGAVNILNHREINEAEDPEQENKRLIEIYERTHLNPYAAAATGAIDSVVSPNSTRHHLILVMRNLRGKYWGFPQRKHGNQPA